MFIVVSYMIGFFYRLSHESHFVIDRAMPDVNGSSKCAKEHHAESGRNIAINKVTFVRQTTDDNQSLSFKKIYHSVDCGFLWFV